MSMNKLLAAFAAVAFAFGIGAVQAADDAAKTEPAAADAKPADAKPMKKHRAKAKTKAKAEEAKPADAAAPAAAPAEKK